MKYNSLLRISLLTCALAFGATVEAASLASDNASNAPYQPSNAWVSGSNGGTGFGSWSFGTTGGGGRYIGGTGLGGTTFGLFAGGGSGNSSTATRSFTGALTTGQTFSVNLGHSSSIATDGEVGVTLLDGVTGRITLKFVGGGSSWLLNDGGSDFGIAQSFAANTPLTFTFTYNGGSSYSYTFGSASGNGFIASSTISNLTGFNAFSNAQGGGENFGINNLTVVPEPSTYAIMISAFLGLVLVARRRKA